MVCWVASAANLSDISTYEAKTGANFTAVSKAGTSIILGSSSGEMFLVTSFGTDATQLITILPQVEFTMFVLVTKMNF